LTPTQLEPYIGLLVQVPLVGIFVWFSLQLINIFLKSISDLRNTFVDSITDRDKEWMIFLEQERKANHEAIGHMAERFADEIRVLGKAVTEMNSRQ